LPEPERQTVLSVLNSERFADLAPRQVYATLLDEGLYLSSVRTMYRILEENGEVRERRDQLRHPEYKKPELLATGPNQVWSWDITKLLGPAKWTYFYLYAILDIFSRFVVGWMVARREGAELAERLLEETIRKQGIAPGQLTVHSDRGPSMSSKSVALLLADLGVTKTHSRPQVSDDNPFSESQFKTLKYRPEFPERFGSLEDARAFCQVFFPWYNWDHHHTGLALLTPGVVHYGNAQDVLRSRQEVLDAAYTAHPERFVRRAPVPLQLPREVWINPPEPKTSLEAFPVVSGPGTRPLAASRIDDLMSTRTQLPPETALLGLSLGAVPTVPNGLILPGDAPAWSASPGKLTRSTTTGSLH
jgi:putative transposase